MSDLALSQGLYMRPLSLRETVVVVMDTLNEFYRNQGWEEARLRWRS